MIEEQQKPAALQANAVVKSFGRGRGRHQVLLDVNVEVWPGECLGIIGASGSGKSTLTRIMFGLEQPDSGDVLFNGASILGASGRAQLRRLRAASGIVYQNPFASLDPRWTAGRSIAEPLRLAGERDERGIGDQVSRALELVGLEPPEFMGRYPMDMSGGQAQRVAIARAVVKNPQVMLADEAMSAIDVAARMQILDAFAAIRERDPNMAMVLVSHDLGVVQNIADRIVVMHEGRVVESGPTAQILEQPQQEYTRLLIAAASL
ncbi:peptide ABC transporter ATPase [Bifidobacterium animalis subsp. animalis]|uniref:ABC transporter ATP-binding protein n=1 Tax=Bifidobacterium animalis TaxID=28025 RepID=UPI001021D940|nr:ABC transporter ATP-binding protein [Bifidobacterium animalis]RYN14804.1 peptide ABC transporter ATPase [Bifidobacterium animalis subsp. animalis]